ELALPVVVTNDAHYARPEGREFQDVLTASRHGRTLDTLADLRRPDGESYLKSGDELMALPPGDGSLGRDVARAWSAGIARAADLGRPAESTSASSSTASPASRCRGTRRRSRTCRSCAGRVP